jgi:uncharacterized membrane protein YagU involved in acid resistance
MTTLLRKLAAIAFALVLGGQVLAVNAAGDESPFPPSDPEHRTVLARGDADSPFPPSDPENVLGRDPDSPYPPSDPE